MSTRGWENATLTDVQHRRKAPQLPQVKSKYRNVKCVVGSETFDSKREAAYWQGLLARQRAGEIGSLQRQVPFALCAPDRTNYDDQHRHAVVVAYYIADFSYYDRESRRHVVDVKSPATAKKETYRLKKKWLELQDGIVIEEV